jgi:hypothetical protein
MQVLFHTGPAYLFDLMAVVTRRKPIMVKISQKMHKATRVRVPTTNHHEETKRRRPK